MSNKIYCCIIKALENKVLIEPFTKEDLENTCLDNFAKSTYNVFLNKHKKGNGKTTELFIKNKNNTYSLIKPYKYACEDIS